MITIPEWAFEFHGHKCPFMPLGYRMGLYAMDILGVERSRNHEMHVLSEMGAGHPQGCMQDGIQAATSATFGKGLMHKLYYGKVAATFYYPGKGGVRLVLQPNFIDEISKHEFFSYRKKGVEPTEIPEKVTNDVIQIILNRPVEELFKKEMKDEMIFEPIKPSFNKVKCEKCGEYVFERYIRLVDGQKLCIPCSGHHEYEKVFFWPFRHEHD